MEERPTKRVALVIGNSKYENLGPIPSAIADKDRAAAVLRALSFDVIEVADVANIDDFYSLSFPRLIGRIAPGDFVVIYFSGHGFTYGDESYLVPTSFPKVVEPNRLPDYAISVTHVRKAAQGKKPGFLLLLLDSCRNHGANIKKTDGSAAPIVKGMGLISIDETNVLLGFASGPGTSSYGSDAAQQLSPYTEAVTEFVGREDVDIYRFFGEVRSRVIYKTHQTGAAQTPWIAGSSSAEIYFKQSTRLWEQEREAWISALRTNSDEAVMRFLEIHSVSRYAASARKWLEDNVGKQSSLSTKISPVAIEAAWTADRARPIAVTRIDGPFAVPRRITFQDGRNPERIPFSGDAQPAIVAAEYIAEAGSTVLTSSIGARSEPRTTSDKVVTLSAGTRVAVEGVTSDSAGQPWLKVALPGNVSGYLPAARNRVTQIELGFSLLEVDVPPDPTGLSTLVDQGALIRSVQKLRSEGKSITRVSISAPQTDDRSVRLRFASRIAHATYILEEAGVPRLSVTGINGAADISGQNLRVRFFGK